MASKPVMDRNALKSPEQRLANKGIPTKENNRNIKNYSQVQFGNNDNISNSYYKAAKQKLEVKKHKRSKSEQKLAWPKYLFERSTSHDKSQDQIFSHKRHNS